MSTLPLLLLLLCLAVTTYARPCKTIFFFTTTTTTTTYYPYISLHRNPNPNFLLKKPRSLTLIFTTTATSHFPHHRPSINFNSKNQFDEDSESSSMMKSSILPLKFSSVSNSIRDRTRDIMSVVGALLFGVVCGAISAAAMYLLWSLFFPRRFDFDYISSSSSDDEDDEDDVTTAKKFGYVAVPGNPDAVDGDLKKTAPPAREMT